MPIKPKNYFKNRKCCECGSSKTTQGFGSPRWHNHKCDKKDCTRWFCHKCYNKVQNRLPDSHNSLIKLMRQCRNAKFDLTKEMCKGCIGVEIVAKALGLKNLNIEMDNSNYSVDLSIHEIYGRVEVKTSSLGLFGWQFEIKNAQKVEHKFDTVLLLCMDHNQPWKDVLRAYAIPWAEVIKHGSSVSIPINSRRDQWVRTFEIEKIIYNNAYHNLDKEYCPRKLKFQEM